MEPNSAEHSAETRVCLWAEYLVALKAALKVEWTAWPKGQTMVAPTAAPRAAQREESMAATSVVRKVALKDYRMAGQTVSN
jgi:hypothetical protein